MPELSEVEVVRHFTRLSTWNYHIDLGLYPLGSCTMKHNPKVNEAVTRLPGFTNAHPYLPPKSRSGRSSCSGGARSLSDGDQRAWMP